ncbi:superoxide dismutase [Mycobacterium tuberculosis]|nr:superoxide dismutase [Mycobacterium tuberculosis]
MLVAAARVYSSGYHAVDLDRIARAVGTFGSRRGVARCAEPDQYPDGADGTKVATAKFEFANGYATVTIATTGVGKLTPGFHGLHIHQVGKCEPNSVAPTGGAPGNFLSAGGHYHVPGHTGTPASGDLASLQVRGDGSAMLVTTTDAFTMDDLLSGAKTAIIIHAGADNFANIPPERYVQVNGTPGPDETTLTTGDAGKRVACGVIGSG